MYTYLHVRMGQWMSEGEWMNIFVCVTPVGGRKEKEIKRE
jgi:hypothetical protein